MAIFCASKHNCKRPMKHGETVFRPAFVQKNGMLCHWCNPSEAGMSSYESSGRGGGGYYGSTASIPLKREPETPKTQLLLTFEEEEVGNREQEKALEEQRFLKERRSQLLKKYEEYKQPEHPFAKLLKEYESLKARLEGHNDLSIEQRKELILLLKDKYQKIKDINDRREHLRNNINEITKMLREKKLDEPPAKMSREV